MALYNPSKKRVIDGIPNLVWGGIGEEVIADDLATDDLTMIPAIKLCLKHIGEEYSKTYLAGTSCAAFYIGWHAEGLGSGMGGVRFPKSRLWRTRTHKSFQGNRPKLYHSQEDRA